MPVHQRVSDLTAMLLSLYQAAVRSMGNRRLHPFLVIQAEDWTTSALRIGLTRCKLRFARRGFAHPSLGAEKSPEIQHLRSSLLRRKTSGLARVTVRKPGGDFTGEASHELHLVRPGRAVEVGFNYQVLMRETAGYGNQIFCYGTYKRGLDGQLE